MNIGKSQRVTIGLILLVLAFLSILAGANLIWGLGGTFIAAGITLTGFAVGFFFSSSDVC